LVTLPASFTTPSGQFLENCAALPTRSPRPEIFSRLRARDRNARRPCDREVSRVQLALRGFRCGDRIPPDRLVNGACVGAQLLDDGPPGGRLTFCDLRACSPFGLEPMLLARGPGHERLEFMVVEQFGYLAIARHRPFRLRAQDLHKLPIAVLGALAHSASVTLAQRVGFVARGGFNVFCPEGVRAAGGVDDLLVQHRIERPR
jgi:hypothetical protein